MILDPRNTSLGSCCLSSIACILYIVGNALPKWGSTKIESNSISFGLWQLCTSTELGTTCVTTTDSCKTSSVDDKPLCSKVPSSQAFMISACIASGLAVPCVLAHILMKRESKCIFLSLCKILLFGAFIVGIIGVALGVAFVFEVSSLGLKPEELKIRGRSLKYKLDASAIISIVAVAINAFSAILSLFIR